MYSHSWKYSSLCFLFYNVLKFFVYSESKLTSSFNLFWNVPTFGYKVKQQTVLFESDTFINTFNYFCFPKTKRALLWLVSDFRPTSFNTLLLKLAQLRQTIKVSGTLFSGQQHLRIWGTTQHMCLQTMTSPPQFHQIWIQV